MTTGITPFTLRTGDVREPRSMSEERIKEILTRQGLSDTAIEGIIHPSTAATQPTSAQIAATAQESAAAQGYQEPSGWQKFLSTLSTPFDWIHRNIEVPIAAVLTSPFTQSTSGTSGKNWLQREIAEYNAWDAPSLHTGVNMPSWLGGNELTFGVKGAAEMLPWLIPGAAAVKPIAAGARVLKGIEGASAAARGARALGNVAEIGARGVLEAERAMAYPVAKPLNVLTGGKLKMIPSSAQQLEKMMAPKTAASAAKSIKNLPFHVAPDGELALAAVADDKLKTAALATGKVKGLKQITKLIGGEAALTTADDAVKIAYLDSRIAAEQWANQGSIYGSMIKNAGDPVKVFGIDERGIALAVEPLKDASGRAVTLSNGIYDIIDNPRLYKLNAQQKAVVQALREANENIDKLLAEYGLKVGNGQGGTYFHRMVKGIESEGGVIERPFGGAKGRAGLKTRKHSTQLDGMKKGVVYEQDPMKALGERMSAAINLASNERMTRQISGLWRTAKDRVNPALYTELSIAKHNEKSAKVLLAAIRRTQRGEKLPGATMAKLQRDYPEIAKALQEAVSTPASPTVSDISKTLSARRAQLISEMKDAGIDTASRTAKQAELAAIKIMRGKGTWQQKIGGLEAELAAIRNELQARATPYRAGMTAGKFKGVPTAEINAQEQALSKFLESLPKTITEKSGREASFSDLIARAQREVMNTSTTRLKAASAKSRALESARAPGWTTLTEEQAKALGPKYKAGQTVAEATVDKPAFSGRIFPEPLADQLNSMLKTEADRWLKMASNISSTSRQLTATFDLSAPFIQGMPVFGRNPYAWAKGTLKQLEFAAKPANLDKYVAENADILSQMVAHGSNIQTSEFVEAGKLLDKWLTTESTTKAGKAVKPVVGKVNKQTLARTEAAWTGYSTVARVEMWKAMAPRMQAAELGELARSLDRMVGVMSTTALGMGANSKAFMNAFGFFAHRYTGACLSLVRDTFAGGLRGSEARKALGNMMASGAAMYMGICKLTGQEPDFNPTSANFMTLNVGGSNVGIGGFFYSLARFGANVVGSGIDIAGSKDRKAATWKVLKPFDTSEGWKLNTLDNPFVYFLRSRTAPLTGTALEIMEGENYYGEPFETVEDYMAFLGSKTLPIWTQSLMDEGGRNPLVTAAEFAGMRTYPKSEWERIKELREAYSQSDYGKRWDELNKLEQERVMGGHDDILKLQSQWNEKQTKRGDTDTLFWNEWDELNTEYNGTLWAAQDAVDSGQMSYAQFREVVSNAASDRAAKQNYLKSRPEYAEVVSRWDDPGTQPDYVGDIAYDEYVSTMYGSDLTDSFGVYNYEERQRRERAFKTKWGDDIFDYVMERLREGKDEPPLMAEYRRVQEMLRPYWNVKDELLALSNSSELKELDALATEVGKTNPELEQYMRSGNAIQLADGTIIRCTALARLQRQIEVIRQYKRSNNPDLAEALSLWYS